MKNAQSDNIVQVPQDTYPLLTVWLFHTDIKFQLWSGASVPTQGRGRYRSVPKWKGRKVNLDRLRWTIDVIYFKKKQQGWSNEQILALSLSI